MRTLLSTDEALSTEMSDYAMFSEGLLSPTMLPGSVYKARPEVLHSASLLPTTLL